MITGSVKRGDIYLCDFGLIPGSVQQGIRPAVVVQNDQYNASSPTTIIAPLTSELKRQDMYSHIVIGKRFGLHKSSMVLLEQIRTVNQTALRTNIGHIDDEDLMEQIDQGIKKVLAIRSERREKKRKERLVYDERDVVCLCPACLNTYRNRGFETVRVGDTSDICDLCNHRTGFDYAVIGLLSR